LNKAVEGKNSEGIFALMSGGGDAVLGPRPFLQKNTGGGLCREQMSAGGGKQRRRYQKF